MLLLYGEQIDNDIFKIAFDVICMKRGTAQLKENSCMILNEIRNDKNKRSLWDKYTDKFEYSKSIIFEEVMSSLYVLLNRLK